MRNASWRPASTSIGEGSAGASPSYGVTTVTIEDRVHEISGQAFADRYDSCCDSGLPCESVSSSGVDDRVWWMVGGVLRRRGLNRVRRDSPRPLALDHFRGARRFFWREVGANAPERTLPTVGPLAVDRRAGRDRGVRLNRSRIDRCSEQAEANSSGGQGWGTACTLSRREATANGTRRLANQRPVLLPDVEVAPEEVQVAEHRAKQQHPGDQRDDRVVVGGAA